MSLYAHSEPIGYQIAVHHLVALTASFFDAYIGKAEDQYLTTYHDIFISPLFQSLALVQPDSQTLSAARYRNCATLCVV